MSIGDFIKIFNEMYENTDEFTISPINKDNELIYDIEQSLVSKKLFLKNIFYGNPNLVLLVSLFDKYQNLIGETIDKNQHEYWKYSGYTHAFMIHILKVLEQNHLIKITSIKKEERINIDEYYKAIGKNNKQRDVQMYIVIFQKIRNFSVEDLDLLHYLLNLLKIDENQIHFYQDMYGAMQVKVKNNVYLKNVYTGNIFKQIKNEMDILEIYEAGQVLRKTKK